VQAVLVGGDVGAHNRRHLRLSYPVSNGVVQHWGDMQMVWEHAFRDVLGADTRGARILLTDPPLNPSANRERMVETMFEEFGFSHVHVHNQAILSLMSTGLLTG
jgi:actin-related protein 2